MIACLFSSLFLLQESARAPRILTEDLDGRAGVLAREDLPLEDPREKGIWLLRPVGFTVSGPKEPTGPTTGFEARLSLANGDALNGRVRAGGGEVLALELVEGVVVPFALEEVQSLVVPSRLDPARLAALAPAKEGDRLYRAVGAIEPIDGALEGFTSEGVSFQSELGLRTTPWSEVAALFLEVLSDAPSVGRPSDVPVRITLAGRAGGRLRAGLVRLEPDLCRLVVGGRTEVSLPHGSVAEILVEDGRLLYLSDLVPSGETGRGAPFGDELGLAWPHRMDENVVGGPLRAGGREYARGIGVHAPTRLSFTLDPPARGLRGSVAIDESSRQHPPAARGSVLFRVHGDGRVLWESPIVRGGDAPIEFPLLGLEGVRELVLEADSAGDFAGDRGDWLGILVVR